MAGQCKERYGKVNVSGARCFMGVQIPQPDIDPVVWQGRVGYGRAWLGAVRHGTVRWAEDRHGEVW